MTRAETFSCGIYMERMGDGNGLNSPATILRDKIYALPEKEQEKIRLKLRNEPCKLPNNIWGDIIEMSEYNKYNRLTDRVEQLLLGSVIRGIVHELIDGNEGKD